MYKGACCVERQQAVLVCHASEVTMATVAYSRSHTNVTGFGVTPRISVLSACTKEVACVLQGFFNKLPYVPDTDTGYLYYSCE